MEVLNDKDEVGERLKGIARKSFGGGWKSIQKRSMDKSIKDQNLSQKQLKKRLIRMRNYGQQ